MTGCGASRGYGSAEAQALHNSPVDMSKACQVLQYMVDYLLYVLRYCVCCVCRVPAAPNALALQAKGYVLPLTAQVPCRHSSTWQG